MSDNYTIVTQPDKWASANKPIRFVYDMPFTFANFTDNNGLVRVTGLSSALAGGKNLVVGDLIYINGGIYKGYHTIVSKVSNIDFTLSAVYSANQSGIMIKYATPPQWQLWKGYQDSEVVGTNPFPFTKVADFSPEGNKAGLLSFDVSGYVKAAMPEIIPPIEGTAFGDVFVATDYSRFMPYRLLIGASARSLYFEDIYLALNSSIDSDVLNAEYLNTPNPLNSNPIIFSCGTTWLSFLSNTRVETFRFDNGGTFPEIADFSNDFSNDFLIT